MAQALEIDRRERHRNETELERHRNETVLERMDRNVGFLWFGVGLKRRSAGRVPGAS